MSAMVKSLKNAELQPVNDDELHAFVAEIGTRVRKIRHENAISRRVLSEISGVSERYLAQLEAGSGNISVALLFKIAHALGKSPSWFTNVGHFTGSPEEILDSYQSASPEVQEDVRQILLRSRAPQSKKKKICLIGLRGAGKSTLGQFAAKKLGIEFCELNERIEQQAGMPVSEIMALYGQDGYRKLEKEALNAVAESRTRVVLAVGGGIVSNPATFKKLLSEFYTIWVRATPQEHMDRVRNQGDQRPMAGNPRAMEDLKSILLNRETLYARADEMIDTSGKSLIESKTDILTVIRKTNG